MKSTPSARHRARRLALQGLYQMQFTDQPAWIVKEQFLEENDHKRADINFFHDIMDSVTIKNTKNAAEILKFFL